ncbi:MAG: alpha-L-fucosidase [Opitutaceae bacterium]|nr:alpha-L-fucosidase [Opitutaceae bacterium]
MNTHVKIHRPPCPAWFRDAKFGIWSHWSAQSVPGVSGWYARNLYNEGHPMANHHRRVYGHPSCFGYKDIIALWRGERFDPVRLTELFRRAGARYVCALAAHHDNFDCWDSRHHPWNSVNHGPRRDIVGEWRRAVRAAGLRFAVSEHLERSYSWFNLNKAADRFGPLASIHYDGADPAHAALYFEHHPDTTKWYPANPSPAFQQNWLDRINDLVEQHDPDLLYTDGGLPFGEIGRRMLANFYARNAERRGGVCDAVYALKDPRMHPNEVLGDYDPAFGLLDVERGVVDGIQPEPWQTDTCVGAWDYDTRVRYKTPREILTLLVDVVSKNGNLLLNFPPRADGTLDDECEWILSELAAWFAVHGEAIHGTRPWKQFSEGPASLAAGSFAESKTPDFGATDFRFTQRTDAATGATTLYVFTFGWPQDSESWRIRALATMPVTEARLLGCDTPLNYRRSQDHLSIYPPAHRPTFPLNCLRLRLGHTVDA